MLGLTMKTNSEPDATADAGVHTPDEPTHHD